MTSIVVIEAFSREGGLMGMRKERGGRREKEAEKGRAHS